MNKPFKSLLDRMPPERRTRIKIKTERLINEMALREPRQAVKRSRRAKGEPAR